MPGNPARGMLGDYLRQIQLKQQHEQAVQQHDLAQKQLDEITKFHQAEIDRMQNEFDLNKTTAAQELKNTLIQHIASGMQQPPGNAQPTGVQQTPGPTNDLGIAQPGPLTSTGSQFNLSPEDLGGLASSLSPADRQINVSSPEEMARRAASAAGQKTAAEEGAKAPLELAKTEALVGGRENVARIAAEQRAKTAEDKNATLLHKMDIIDATQKYKTDHNLNNVNESELAGQADDASLGVGDLPKGANGIHTEAIIRGQGRVPFQQKQGQAMDALSDFDGLVSDMKNAANGLPDTAPGIQQAQQFGNTLINKLPWQTDLKNSMAGIKAKTPQVLRGLQGVTRINIPEIQAQLDNTVNASMGKQQALGNIDRFQRDMYTKAYSDLMGAVPTKQKVGIMAKHGGIDRWRGVNVTQKDGSVGPVIKKMPNGHEAMYNPNKDNYEDIEDYK